MNVARWRHSKATLQGGCEICSDIAKHVVRDNHFEIARAPDHLEHQGVDIEVLGFNSWKASRSFLEGSLPQVSRITHHVGFIGHADLASLVLQGMLESIFENPFNALTRVDFLLNCDFLGGSLLEHTSAIYISAFRVLTNDDKVNFL